MTKYRALQYNDKKSFLRAIGFSYQHTYVACILRFELALRMDVLGEGKIKGGEGDEISKKEKMKKSSAGMSMIREGGEAELQTFLGCGHGLQQRFVSVVSLL